MTKPSARSGIGAATTLHAITALLLILIGAKIARTLPFASGVCIMLILAMPAILAAGFAEATRRTGGPAILQWLSFPPFWAAMTYIVASLPQLLGN